MTKRIPAFVALALATAVAVVGALGAATTASAELPANSPVYVGDYSLKSVAVVDPLSGETSLIPTTEASPSVAVSPDGSRVFSRGLNGSVFVIDAATQTHVDTWAFGTGWTMAASALALTEDGSMLAVAGGRRTSCVVTVADAQTGAVIRDFSASVHPSQTRCTIGGVAFSPDASTLYAVDSTGNQLVVFDTATGELLGRLDKVANPDRMHNNPVSLALTADGSQLLVSFDPAQSGE